MVSAKAALHLFFASLLLAPLLANAAKTIYIAQSDRQPLMDLMKGFGPNANLLKNWNFKYGCSLWEGVTCDSTGRVTALSLQKKTFSALSASIGGLSALTSLTLSNDKLKGPIPSTIGKLSKLSSLELGSNNFTGTIPEELYKCTSLTYLGLSSNQLYGPISTKINALTKIFSVDVSDNLFSGRIPPLAASLFYIDQFNANGNYFYTNDLNVNFYDRGSYFLRNCLANPPLEYPYLGGVQAQRPAAECAKFCNAGSSKGPCGGNGYCYFNKSTPNCLCSTGYKPSGITCVKG